MKWDVMLPIIKGELICTVDAETEEQAMEKAIGLWKSGRFANIMPKEESIKRWIKIYKKATYESDN